VVNNLGIFEAKPFLEIPDSDWLRFFEVNVLSGVRLSRHFLPGMLKKKWGRVIFISSESAQHIPAEMVHYGMTKTAQVAIARGIAESVVGTGVTVNSILAGPTASEGVGGFVEDMAKQQASRKPKSKNSFFQPSALLRFSNVSRLPKKLPPSLRSSPARRQSRSTAPRCAPRVGSSAVSSRRPAVKRAGSPASTF